MNPLNSIFILFAFLIPASVSSQEIVQGKVTSQNKSALPGANVYWLGTTQGVVTDGEGRFKIQFNEKNASRLVISFVGYTSDTVEIPKDTKKIIEISLAENELLEEVLIKGRQDGIVLSALSPIKTEQITETELRKAACCDLAGCFETQASVQPHTTNLITNAKELRILGLSGVYNQVLIDGFPMIEGLSYTYGISSIPGTLVKNIYVSKGANSVLQGYESISGQINVITKEPGNDTERILLNAFMNSSMEKQVNANYGFKTGKWTNLTSFHTVQPAHKTDENHDAFLDMPLITRYMLYNKTTYGRENDWGWYHKTAIRLLNENRTGGQLHFNLENDEGSTNAYGQTLQMNQPEIYSKTAYRLNDQHHVELFVSSLYQKQRSFFGTVQYSAEQTSFYSNLQYELNYAKHNLKTGISFRHLNLDESIGFSDTVMVHRNYDGLYAKQENIPGIFAENTMYFADDQITWIAGLRADMHQEHGMKFAPRSLIKYNITPQSVIRANAGTGWRSVHLFSENIGLLASSRNIVLTEALKPEQALNYGINFTQKFNAMQNNVSGHISTDFYRTEFMNQVFPDYDTDPTLAIISNFTGTSISNGFQAELLLNLSNRLEVKTGYNFLDVYRIIEDEKWVLPFNAKHKILTTLSYQAIKNVLFMDVNVHWYGKQRLPDTKSNPVEFQRPNFSDPYSLFNTQVTYILKRFELYAGCENILGYRQDEPIISWQNPFGPYFDTSLAWGPTKGRELYAGIRYKL